MRLDALRGNSQRLDGGSMFGNCPRALWERWCLPDEHHRIPLGCRSLLVREPGRTVLLEAGIGAYLDPAGRRRYGVQEERHVLLDSLRELGIGPGEIDVVVLSHLHFDHAGGLLNAWREDEPPTLAFPNAHYVVGREAWERASRPHARDRASFIPGLTDLLAGTGRVEVVTGERSALLGAGYQLIASHGHTPGMILTRLETARGPITFGADLVFALPWVHLPITAGYDRYPELVIDEKRAFLERLREEDGWVLLTHDAEYAATRVSRSEDGRFTPRDAVRELAWDA